MLGSPFHLHIFRTLTGKFPIATVVSEFVFATLGNVNIRCYPVIRIGNDNITSGIQPGYGANGTFNYFWNFYVPIFAIPADGDRYLLYADNVSDENPENRRRAPPVLLS